MDVRRTEWDTLSAILMCLIALVMGLTSRGCWKEEKVIYPPSKLEIELPKGPFEYHLSTWYGPGKGLRNSDGTPFKGDKLTCASNVFMRGTILDLQFRGKVVRVKVNDFGPTVDINHPLYNEVHDNDKRFKSIDCSKKTAEELNFKRYGAARLKVYIVKCTGRYRNNKYDRERWDLRNIPKY